MAGYKQAGKIIVPLDESGFAHDMPRTHGYSPIGWRCYGKHDWGGKDRTNVIGALLGGILIGVTLFTCNIDSDVFHDWVKFSLLPALPPASVVVLDNATFHKRRDTQKLITEAGHILEYLPPYSPDLNPIEKKWAQKKSERKARQCSIDDLFK